MIRKHKAKPATPAAPPPVVKMQTDPINVIAQHWADLSGMKRDAALNQLALIGHMAMKENTAGITELKRELQQLIAEKEHNEAMKRKE